jgi:hypothetical protein
VITHAAWQEVVKSADATFRAMAEDLDHLDESEWDNREIRRIVRRRVDTQLTDAQLDDLIVWLRQ